MKHKTKKISYTGLLLSFALVLSYVESILPFSFGVPGIKLGLPNFAVVLTLYIYGGIEAFFVDVLRIVLNAFLFGNMFALLYSLAGGMLSFFVMYLMKKTNFFSIIGVSIGGGVFHNIGQILIAYKVVESEAVFYYLPALMIAGILTGGLIGILTNTIRKRLHGFMTLL